MAAEQKNGDGSDPPESPANGGHTSETLARLTLHAEPGVGRQLPQLEGVDGLVLRGAALDLQRLHPAVGADLVLVSVLQLHAVLDPLGALHVQVGELQREHGLLGLRHRLVPQGLLDLHGWRRNTGPSPRVP